MPFHKVSITAIGYELPREVVTTAALEQELAPVYQALRVPIGQLESMTGIRERRWWPRGQPIAAAAATAGAKTLAQVGMSATDLGAVIYTGVCRDLTEPATACEVASRLGVSRNTIVHDISNACLGVMSGMIDIANRIELGQIRAGLVVSCESARDINEHMLRKLRKHPNMNTFKESLATFTGGSGAVGVLLTDGSFGDGGHALRSVVTRAAPEHHHLCRWGMAMIGDSLYEPFMKTDAIAVLQHGVELGKDTWAAFREDLGWTSQSIDRVICHQIGKAHKTHVLRALELEERKDFSTFATLGNMGTVSLPITAAMASEHGFLQPGHSVGFLGIGSGLNCMMMGVTW